MIRKYASPLLLCFFLAACSSSFNDLLATGKKAFNDKDYAGAIDKMNLAVARWKSSDGNDKKAEAFEVLGQSYHALQKNDKAVVAFKEAVQASDNSYASAYELGIMALASKEPQEALLDFRDALRMKKEDPLALIGLGNSYFEMRDYKNAQLIYDRVLDTSPGVRDALRFLQITNEKISKKAKPVKHVAKKKKPSKTAPQNMSLKKKRKHR